MKCNHGHEHGHDHAHEHDAERRLFLQAVGAGLLATMLPTSGAFAALPSPLAIGRSVYHISGHAWVNGKRIHEHTHIGPNDTIKTADGSKLIFAVGNQAMLLRESSHLVLQGTEQKDDHDTPLVNFLRLLSGALLSVSRHKGLQIQTPNVLVGLRGTGVYLEAGPEKTYFCDCYGDVDVTATHDDTSKDSVHSEHHDRPLYIFNDAPPGRFVRNVHDKEFAPRPMNHSDAELELIEALVGRTPPFVKQG